MIERTHRRFLLQGIVVMGFSASLPPLWPLPTEALSTEVGWRELEFLYAAPIPSIQIQSSFIQFIVGVLMRKAFTQIVIGLAVASFFAISLVPSVAANEPPTINVVDYIDIPMGVTRTYTVDAYDPDSDPLRFTWDWGDGDTDVTTSPSAEHIYSWSAAFTLTVHADDLTGLPGHNVSDSGNVYVFGIVGMPEVTEWSVDNANPYVGEVVTFTASAYDGECDHLWFTFVFGDGDSVVEEGDPTYPDCTVTLSMNKSYDVIGLKTARIHVFDGSWNVTTLALTIDVVTNKAPTVSPLPDLCGEVGETLTFEADAIDPDPTDVLTFTWDFGDGTPLVVGNPVTHEYTAADVYLYRVWVDDDQGHNVTAAASAHVLAKCTLNIEAGWNLVTVPMVDHGYKASTIGLMTGDVVAGYNPTTMTYDQYFIVDIYPSIYDFDLEPNYGYWVFTTTAQTLDLVGDLPTTVQSREIVMPSGGGWALVGVPTTAGPLYASDVIDMYSGTAMVVAAYNTLTGTYQTHYAGTPTDFELTPGDGLWLFATDSGWLTYEP